MITWQSILLGGWQALVDYIWNHTFTCLLPAFFIAGAIATFVSKESILKYFGPQANKIISYTVASISGAILAVCSCTVLPLFAGIYRRGAGLGPAFAFLYSGPAINILAIVYTARLLGFELGLARAIFAVIFAATIGIIMSLIFIKEEQAKKDRQAIIFTTDGSKGTDFQRLLFLLVLISILLTATAKIPIFIKWPSVIIEIILIIYFCLLRFEQNEVKLWLAETWNLIKLITPVLIIGVFAAGIIKVIMPPNWVSSYVGGNTLIGNFIASFSGALMYFATLTEVPIIKSLIALGMGKGPVLALLLAGPALSIPSILAIQRIVGTKKTLSYLLLVVFFSTFVGLLFGSIT